jgi:diguanylate cyclase (GGDEF)-like protein
LPADFSVSGFVYHYEPGFIDMLGRYRWQLGMIALVFFTLFLAFYNFRLRNAVRERTSALNKLNLELEKLSLLDGLTGIGNRRMFEQAFSHEWNRAMRNQYPLSLIMIDIDYFKPYNDYYGHQQGDDCLRRVANTLTGVCKRAEDTVSRFGGEEFVVLLPGMDMAHAANLAEQCRVAVAGLAMPHAQSTADRMVTISLGVGSVLPDAGIDARSLLASADKHLYQAKKQGRNQVVCE